MGLTWKLLTWIIIFTINMHALILLLVWKLLTVLGKSGDAFRAVLDVHALAIADLCLEPLIKIILTQINKHVLK